MRLNDIKILFSQEFWDKDPNIVNLLIQKKNQFSKSELRKEKRFKEFEYFGRFYGHDPDNEDKIY